MTIRALTSTTAVAICLTLNAPAAMAQGNRPFPCVAPTGVVTENPRELSQQLMEMVRDPAIIGRGGPDSIQVCSAGALQRGVDRGGDALQAAIGNSSDEVRRELTALGVLAAPANQGELPAPGAEEPPRQAEADAPRAQEEAPGEPQNAQADPDTANPPAAERQQRAQGNQDQPRNGNRQQQAGNDQRANPARQQQAQDDQSANGNRQQNAQSANADRQVGEAGQQQLTDAQRQRRAQARAERREAAAAARAERQAAAGEETGEEAQAEVQTRTVAEEDVRRADEDFDTAVNENVQAQAQDNDDDEGLSTFEKALLLGLGTAAVGAFLNNGDEVVSNSGDRVVVERDGELRVLKNDDELLAQPGAEVASQTYRDGSTRETITYEDGRQVITVRGADGTVLRRSVIRAENGEEVVLFDDTQAADPIDFDTLPEPDSVAFRQAAPMDADQQALERALQAAIADDVGRRFSLQQVRDYKQVRALAPEVELTAVTFATGSAAIQPSQADALADLGLSMRDIIAREPDSVFLIEGHTDAVGSASTNLALSDRRAETVALALTQYFDVPPQNLITQGYGETDLKVQTLTDERANRRAAVRNITGLLY
ncbi:OmpA family protein [Marinibacterium profundimaris]|uniref:OmpA family protein n=1 Tax=Marinibacterium profundimaris TaxID=1679460 RepID=UPI001303A292|nr:OmpA family protein [Marinibacterium profundimaris]